MRFVLVLAVCLTFGINANAQDSLKDSKKCDGACPVEAAMQQLPEMQYKVNGKLIQGCIQCAKVESQATKKPILYVVLKKEFQDESKAKQELLAVTEKMVKDFSTPCQCEVSKTTTVAGKKCSCPIEAAERTKLVSAAMAKVAMHYKVGDQKCDCPIKAKSLAEKTGQPKEFVVNDECLTCELTAKLELARAKYQAGLEAIAKLDNAKK